MYLQTNKQLVGKKKEDRGFFQLIEYSFMAIN